MDVNSSYEVAIMASNGFDQPSIPTIPSNGNVTHLGVVGRGVKCPASKFHSRAEQALRLLLDRSTYSISTNKCHGMLFWNRIDS